MKLPDARSHLIERKDDPAYMKKMFKRTGLSQAECAKRIGVATSTLRTWVDAECKIQWPYSAQYTIEQLAEAGRQRSK